MRVYLEADLPRVSCAVLGVAMAAVPWARHGAGHTRAFDETVDRFVVSASRKLVAELWRVNWHTVGAIVERVMADSVQPQRQPGRCQAGDQCTPGVRL